MWRTLAANAQLTIVVVAILSWWQCAPQIQRSSVQELAKERTSASNVAFWARDAQRELEVRWTGEGREKRRFLWKRFWRTQPEHKDWYNSEGTFLQHLLPRLPHGARCMELGAGRSSLASSVYGSGKVQSLLSIDIDDTIVSEQSERYAAEILQGGHRLDFQVADAFGLSFSDFKRFGWQRFDMVFEKAGLFDIHNKPRQTGLIQRLLACIVTEAFEPTRGGSLIALVREKPDDSAEDCADCGLIGAVSARPDFNCTIAERFPLSTTWFGPTSLKVVVVECGGVPHRYAAAGCDAVWLRSLQS
jgi:hypothetical protein